MRCTRGSPALGIVVPRHALTPGSSALRVPAPAFFEDGPERDCVVWAARGSGKTFYAAVATALDLAFKPGVQVKILGGSLQQSARMHEHLRDLFKRPALAAGEVHHRATSHPALRFLR
ncbi:MAG: DEAD/DEAH box helicase family protein [Phycisphaerales bacterium]